jgi:hypothetical protein
MLFLRFKNSNVTVNMSKVETFEIRRFACGTPFAVHISFESGSELKIKDDDDVRDFCLLGFDVEEVPGKAGDGGGAITVLDIQTQDVRIPSKGKGCEE